MKKALINIDFTNDFVATNGALTCGEPAQMVEQRVHDITKEFIVNGEYVVFGIDGHEEGDIFHPETKLFPAHNIIGTKGRELFGSLHTLYEENKAVVSWVDKTRYSAFAGTDVEIKLRERGIEEVHLVGVCTDICVLHTAVDLYNKGYKIVVHEDAVASFNPVGHAWALEHMKNTLGATIVSNYERKGKC